MPLRDHFRPPLDNVASWEELPGGWPAVIVQQLKRILPTGIVAAPYIRANIPVEMDRGDEVTVSTAA